MTEDRRHFYGVIGKKIAVCVCFRSDKSITLELPLAINSVTGYEKTGKKFSLPKTLNVQSGSGLRSRYCIQFVFFERKHYEIPAYLKQRRERSDVSFSVSVITLSKFVIREVTAHKGHLEVHLHQFIFFRLEVFTLKGAVIFQIDFSDGVTEQYGSNRGSSEFVHAYQKIGTYNVSVFLAYTADSGFQCLAHSFSVSVTSGNSYRGVERRLKEQSDRTHPTYRWEFLQDGIAVGHGQYSSIRKFRMKETNTEYLTERTDFQSNDLTVQSLSSAYITSISMVPYRGNLAVKGKNFTIEVIVEPLGETYQYLWTSIKGNTVYIRQNDNLATFKALKGSSDLIMVFVNSRINRVTSSYTALIEKPFDQFTVEYRSNNNFEFGFPIRLQIKSDGLDRSGVRYTLICQGLHVAFTSKNGHTTYLDATLPLYGNLTCDLIADVASPYTPIDAYCAPGVTPTNRQYIISRNKIQNLTYDVKVNGTRMLSKAIPINQIFFVELTCDGVGARLKVQFQDIVFEHWAEWNQTLNNTKTVFQLSSKKGGSFNILLSAWNYVSNKSKTFEVLILDRITDFAIETPDYIVVKRVATFSLSPHNGTSVTYKWNINNASIDILNEDRHLHYIFNASGQINISVIATNEISKAVANKQAYVYEDLTYVSWGYTQNITNIATNKSFPINLTIHSGLPVSLSIEVGSHVMVNRTVKPSVNNVFYYAFGSPGLYDINAVVSSPVGSRLQLSHVLNVENTIKGVVSKWTRNISTFCVPFDMEIYATAEQGTNIYCNISSGSTNTATKQALYDSINKVSFCRVTYRLINFGTYQFSTAMYNSVSAEKVFTKPIHGVNSSMSTFALNITSGYAKFGTDSLAKIVTDFDCPFASCSIDFGDGSSPQVSYQIQNGSVFRHVYSAIGLYLISGRVTLSRKF